jgi:hypothetical protein
VHEFPSRVKCATLAWHTLNAALDGRRRRAVSEDATVNRPETHARLDTGGRGEPRRPKVDEEAVIAAIKTVYDPEIPVDIYQLGLIYAVEIEDDGA